MDNSFYKREEEQTLFWLLQSVEFTSALVYLVCRRNYSNIKITASSHSIEIWNEEFTIVIILSAAFEKRHYQAIRNITNLHIITFSPFFNCDFNFNIDDIYIKTISTNEWLDEVLKRSNNEEVKRINKLIDLKLRIK
ncbi:MAG: hypothetical protein KKH44_11980 [Bacteroidetes bacterium]|nr:hypothetical protein [Bacteroidota bacterium]